jgi:hypothetical protein
MGYIKPPPPPDDEVIFTANDGTTWTWGEHRRMEKSLLELEMTDDEVRKARQRLDDTLARNGYTVEVGPVVLQCEFCGESEYKRHKEDCPDYYKDLPVTREAGAYQWLDENFQIVHQTSVCVNDEEACDYFRIVQVWFPNVNLKYVMRRELRSSEFKMIPWQYDRETNAVTPIERPKS